MARNFYPNRFESPIIPSETPRTPKYPTQTFTKVFSGLPPNSNAVLVDTLIRVRENMGQERPIVIATFLIPASGTLTIPGLRPSIYSLLFKELKYQKYNQNKFNVGDPTNAQIYGVYRKPSAVTLSVDDTALNNDNPYVEVSWTGPYDGSTGINIIQYSGAGDAAWTTFKEIYDPLITSCSVGPLESSLDYSFRILTQNSDEFPSTSEVVTQLTPTTKLSTIASGADVTADNEAATVASLAGHDADDLDASATRFWAGEAGADVTDATNVASAGAIMGIRQISSVLTEGDNIGATNIPAYTAAGIAYETMYITFLTKSTNDKYIKFTGQALVSTALNNATMKLEIFDITGTSSIGSSTITFSNAVYQAVTVSYNASALAVGTTYQAHLSIIPNLGDSATIKGGAFFTALS